MKVNNPQGMRGSFGIPQEVQEAAQRAKEQKERQSQPKEAKEERRVVEDWPIEASAEELKVPEDLPVDENVEDLAPFRALEEIGITATEEDFHDLIFRGYIEKVVPVQVNPLKKDEVLNAKIKLLTVEEYDCVDELVSLDLDEKKMTTTGLEARRSMWILSLAVSELFGKPLCKPVMSKSNPSEVDLMETAKARRKVLSKINATVVNRMIFIHTKMHSAFQQIQQEANADFLKKS